jgi:hypothetical protein
MLIFVIVGNVFAQTTQEEIIEFKYQKKSVAQAALMSAVLPGSGQFYVSKKSITAYIFPIIEIGLWYGMLHNNKLGNDAEKDYEDWAVKEVIGHYEYDSPDGNFSAGDPIYRYERWRYDEATHDLIINANNDFYDNHFRLDETNTQHFFEDIGKYNRYIFGWADWHEVYAESGYNWIWDDDSAASLQWVGNHPTNIEYFGDEYWDTEERQTKMRDEYIVMRADAEVYFDKAQFFNFGILANHLLAAADAIWVTKRYNKKHSDNKIKVSFAPVYIDNSLYAGLFIRKGF